MATKKSRKEKPTMTPNAYMDHDKKFQYIEVELPGVKKEDIELSVSDQSFCVRAPREDIEFIGCYVLTHLAETDNTKAKYGNGILSIESPLKKQQKDKKVTIE